MSEIGNYPKAHVTLFQLGFGLFTTSAVRQKLHDHIQKNLSEERVKTLTRQEISDYGKMKLIISEVESLKTPEQQMAQSAADKIFEMIVHARKAKKDKYTRLEEEATAKASEGQTQELVEMDSNIVDQMIMLVDYPTTQKEYLALSEYGQNINCFFNIYQVQENTDGTAPIDLKTAKQVSSTQDEAENERFEKF